MLKPQQSSNREYERVTTDDFVIAKIEDIQFEQEHKFTFQGQESVYPAVRFKFSIEGYKFPHYSRWMKFNYGDKSNIYLKFLQPLVEGAEPNMDFDLSLLKGLKIKMLWAQKGDFQYPETIRPVGAKIKAVPEIEMGPQDDSHDEYGADNEVPF